MKNFNEKNIEQDIILHSKSNGRVDITKTRNDINMKKIKEFSAANEDELLEQVMLWPNVDKEWDKGWKRIEPKKNKGQ